MGENNEIYIGNEIKPMWKKLIDEYIEQKRTLRMADQDGKELDLSPNSKYEKQLQSYGKKMKRYFEDPVSAPADCEGPVFDLLVTEILEKIFKPNTVFPTPASFDFNQKNDKPLYLPSSDIMVGELIPGTNLIIPQLLVAASLKSENPNYSHSTLKIPVASVHCTSLFGFTKDTIYNFANSRDPLKFIEENGKNFKPELFRSLSTMH